MMPPAGRTEMMLMEIGTRLAPFVWGGTAYAIAALVAFLVGAVSDMGGRCSSPSLVLSSRRAGVPTVGEHLDEAA